MLTLQDELYPELSLYTLQPDTAITKDMDHDTVLATDVVSLLTESQVSLLTESQVSLLTENQVSLLTESQVS